MYCCFYYVFEYRKQKFHLYLEEKLKSILALSTNHAFSTFKCIVMLSMLKYSDNEVLISTSEMYKSSSSNRNKSKIANVFRKDVIKGVIKVEIKGNNTKVVVKDACFCKYQGCKNPYFSFSGTNKVYINFIGDFIST